MNYVAKDDLAAPEPRAYLSRAEITGIYAVLGVNCGDLDIQAGFKGNVTPGNCTPRGILGVSTSFTQTRG